MARLQSVINSFNTRRRTNRRRTNRMDFRMSPLTFRGSIRRLTRRLNIENCSNQISSKIPLQIYVSIWHTNIADLQIIVDEKSAWLQLMNVGRRMFVFVSVFVWLHDWCRCVCDVVIWFRFFRLFTFNAMSSMLTTTTTTPASALFLYVCNVFA